jgi:hypothetical protein
MAHGLSIGTWFAASGMHNRHEAAMPDPISTEVSSGPGTPERKTRARATGRSKGPTAAEMSKLASIRKQLSAARQEVTEATEASRDAEARLTAVRLEADVLRRMLTEIETHSTSIRGSAEAAWIGVERGSERVEQLEKQFAGLRASIEMARREYAQLESETAATLERFRAAVEEMRRAWNGDLPAEAVADLPESKIETAGEDVEGARSRLAHLLNGVWSVEKELAGMLHSLAEESEYEALHALIAQQCEDSRRRMETVARRLESMEVHPSDGRGFLGRLAARVWDAVQAPRDPADRVLIAVLKGLSASEFLVGLYRAVHVAAHAAHDVEAKKLAAAQFRELRSGVEAFHQMAAKATLMSPAA